MEDAFGNTLEPGDSVAFTWNGGELMRGTVVESTRPNRNGRIIPIITDKGKKTKKIYTMVAKV